MGTRGGRREGSGPKKSMSPYGEKTEVIRVPVSFKSDVLVYLEPFQARIEAGQNIEDAEFPQGNVPIPRPFPRPLYSGKISAGQSAFPLLRRTTSRRRWT